MKAYQKSTPHPLSPQLTYHYQLLTTMFVHSLLIEKRKVVYILYFVKRRKKAENTTCVAKYVRPRDFRFAVVAMKHYQHRV